MVLLALSSAGAAAQTLTSPAEPSQAAPAQPLAPPPVLQPGMAEPAVAPLPPPANIVDEVKLGVLAHDVGFLTHHVEEGQDVNLEVLFTSASSGRRDRISAPTSTTRATPATAISG
jgi:hypothetical protein